MGKIIYDFINSSSLKELLRYLIVGGLATIVEWACFWGFCNLFGIQYLMATVLAFTFSTLANWVFGRLLVFGQLTGQSFFKEIGSIYLVSLVGLLLNLIIMFVMVRLLLTDEMFSKMAATVLVFVYNYLVRKFLIYRDK